MRSDEMSSVLQVDNVSVCFAPSGMGLFQSKPAFLALSKISFDLKRGETLGIVGESGSGKTTLAKTMLGLISPATGKVTLATDIKPQGDIQFVFQDPLSALNPRMTMAKLILEPLNYLPQKLSHAERQSRLHHLIEQVGLDSAHSQRYAHEFSGGQCQRIGIARAMITRPKLLICDEPVSALDVSIRAQILTLLKTLQAEQGFSLVFIAHDLSLVRYISDRLLVLYQGNMMEYGDSEAIFNQPSHPYTEALLRAEPKPDPDDVVQWDTDLLAGAEPTDTQVGCLYQPRCRYARPDCAVKTPLAQQLATGVQIQCHYPLAERVSL